MILGKDKFPERLRAAFNDARNADIAGQLGVSKATITLYMNGHLPPSNMLLKISEITGCSVHWLMTGQEPKWIRPAEAQPTREARIIAVHSFGAGGTGKSTAAAFIAMSLARRGYRTLLVEPYEQHYGSVLMFTQFLYESGIGLYDASKEWEMTRQLFKTPVKDLDMYVGSPQSRSKLLEHGVQHFSAVPSELRRKYSFIIMDTEPSYLSRRLDLLRARLLMSAQILVPCDFNRYESIIDQCLLNLGDAREQSDEIQVLGAFINKSDTPERRVEVAKKVIDGLLPGKAFKTVIHRTVEIPNALVKGIGACGLGPKSKSVREYDNLTEELLLRVGD